MDKRLVMPGSVAQVTLKFRRAGSECRHVMYVQRRQLDVGVDIGPSNMTDDVADAGAGKLFDAYKSAYQSAADASLQAYGVEWVYASHSGDVTVLHEGEHGVTPWSGTNTGHPAPNNVALCIKLGTGLGGRSSHGRFYFAGVNDGLYDSSAPNQLKAGSVTDFAAHNEAFRSAVHGMDIDEELGTGNFVRLGVCSFYSAGALRTEAQFVDVTQVTLTDIVFDSQRKRLPGRGA